MGLVGGHVGYACGACDKSWDRVLVKSSCYVPFWLFCTFQGIENYLIYFKPPSSILQNGLPQGPLDRGSYLRASAVQTRRGPVDAVVRHENAPDAQATSDAQKVTGR